MHSFPARAVADKAEALPAGTNSAYTLAELYAISHLSYKNLLQNLGSIESFDITSTNKLLDEYGRFVTWGEQTRVYLSSHSRGSLDDHVQDHSSIKQVLESTLGQLASSIESVERIVRNTVEFATVEQLTIHDNQITGSDTDSDPDLPPASFELYVPDEQQHGMSPPRKSSALAMIMREISEQMRLLYEASALLKRPGIAGRYLRSNKPDEGDGCISSEFVPFDVGHVQEKLVEWYNSWASTNREGYMGRISSSEMTAQADLHVSEPLILRLARANVKRRKQLSYWLEHSDVPESTVVDVDIRSSPEMKKLSLPSGPSIANIGTSASREMPLIPSQTGETLASKASFSIAVVSDMNVMRKDEEMRTQYEESVVGSFAPVSVPPLPRVARIHEKFKCPYCGLELQSILMRERRAWKEHVFRDLRPYTCTFPSCASGSRLYHARRDWIHHEKQMHRRRWVCLDGCHGNFPSPESFVNHLHTNHGDRVEKGQLSLLLTLSERPLEDDTIDRCPLCPMALSLPSLYPHVAQHLEQLSLFVLFSFVGEIDVEAGSNASDRAQDHLTDDLDEISSDAASAHEGSFVSFNWVVPSPGSSEDVSLSSDNAPDWDSLLSDARAMNRSDQPDQLLLDLQDKQLMRTETEESSKAGSVTQPSGAETSEFSNIDELVEFLEEHTIQTSFNGRLYKFLPREAFERATTAETIHCILSAPPFDQLDPHYLSKVVLQTHKTSRKIFATFVHSRFPLASMHDLLKLSLPRLSDDQLPLDEDYFYFKTLANLGQERLVTRFLRSQEYFNVAFFELGSFQELDSRKTLPIDFEEIDGLLPGELGFGSNRYKFDVSLSGYHSFPFPEERELLTMRIFHKDNYSNESVRRLLQVEGPDIEHAFAAFTLDSKLYILQEGRSRLFEHCMQDTSRSIDLSRLLDELGCIARAVDGLTRVDFAHQNVLGHSKDQPRPIISGITPSRIIVHERDLVRFRLQLDPDDFTDRTNWDQNCGSYKAPETPDQARIADATEKEIMWSLGCTILEAMIWQFGGFELLEQFRRHLIREDGQSPVLYEHSDLKIRARPRIHSVVRTMFDSLLNTAGGQIRDTVRFVQTMLDIDPNNRPSALEVSRVLALFASVTYMDDKMTKTREER